MERSTRIVFDQSIEHDITTRLFADLPEFTEAGDPQPPYDEWAQQYWRDKVKPHAAPLSDRAWIHYWPDEAVFHRSHFMRQGWWIGLK